MVFRDWVVMPAPCSAQQEPNYPCYFVERHEHWVGGFGLLVCPTAFMNT